jgi:uncharacterized protein (DUF2252 family)
VTDRRALSDRSAAVLIGDRAEIASPRLLRPIVRGGQGREDHEIYAQEIHMRHTLYLAAVACAGCAITAAADHLGAIEALGRVALSITR